MRVRAYPNAAMWSMCAAVAGPAEFAFRWDTALGGPSTASGVVAALQLQAGMAKRYMVRYVDVVQPV